LTKIKNLFWKCWSKDKPGASTPHVAHGLGFLQKKCRRKRWRSQGGSSNHLYREGFMKLKNGISFALLTFPLLMAGCQRAADPPKPTTSSAPASTSQPSPTASVAAPPASLPPSDAAIKPPAAPATSSGNADGPTQANPTELSKAEEQAKMPLSGQVNNHSVPDTTGEKKQ
jgi:hypothetical protein